MEMWLPIEGFENHKVSNTGKILSPVKGLLKPTKMKNGYLTTTLGKDKKLCRMLVHRIVAATFVKNPLNYDQVNHINGNKSDNRADNLEWCTRSHNMLHAFRNGLIKRTRIRA